MSFGVDDRLDAVADTVARRELQLGVTGRAVHVDQGVVTEGGDLGESGGQFGRLERAGDREFSGHGVLRRRVFDDGYCSP
jgi:hypothetical protein